MIWQYMVLFKSFGLNMNQSKQIMSLPDANFTAH